MVLQTWCPLHTHRMRRQQFLLTAVLLLCLGTPVAQAQDEPEQIFASINWVVGPDSVDLGKVARIYIPPRHVFADGDDTRKFKGLMENISSGEELGMIVPLDSAMDFAFDQWFVEFEFNAMGYVPDDEKDDLDADAILKSIREGTEEANKEREKRGWTTMEVVGWQYPPYYDSVTHNLEWAVKGRAGDGQEATNFNTRLLGRRGVMEVTLITDPAQLDRFVPDLKMLLAGFSYNPGGRYAEFVEGDKVAQYGLAALAGGTATAVAMKSGVFKYLWKILAVAAAALATFAKRIWAAFRGEEKAPTQQQG